MTPAFTVAPYRYNRARPHVIRCPSSDGFATRASRLAEQIGGQYTGRAGGYLVTPRQLERFLAAVAALAAATVQPDRSSP